ncbi:MAG: NADH-quinone oxidoreductase subunit J [Candidatus Kapabacteria bacterium]|nr:NADH-quinone oxidoreductase subunit J [Candidatus Kapabacteria bacterium]
MLEALFYIFAAMIIGSAAVTAFTKNILYAAFALLFTFFGVAAIYVLLSADFLAISQIMIYIGGILVLIIFGVMLTTNVSIVDIKEGFTGKTSFIIAGIFSAITCIFFIYLAFKMPFINHAPKDVKLPNDSTIKPLGKLLMTNYLLAFEVASVVLLIAIIGAAMIARRHDD